MKCNKKEALSLLELHCPTYSDPASFLDYLSDQIYSLLYILYPAPCSSHSGNWLPCCSVKAPDVCPLLDLCLSALAVCFLCWNALLPSIYIIHSSLPSALCWISLELREVFLCDLIWKFEDLNSFTFILMWFPRELYKVYYLEKCHLCFLML